jgi:glycogen(starch) synthase
MSPTGRHLRVLMTTDTVGGVFHYAVELARALAREGVTTVLAAMGGHASVAQRRSALAVPGLSLHESSYRLEWMNDPWSDVDRAGAWLRQLEEETAPDVVHLNGYAHASLPWRAPTVVVGHSCVLSWFEAVRGDPAPRDYDEYRARVARGLASASCVVAPTRAMAHALREHYGPRLACRVIHNGRRARAFGTSAKEPFVLSVGRLWDEAKNVAALAAVAPALPWPVRVAGSPSLEGTGELQAAGVEWLGILDEAGVCSVMGRAAIYALPARYEPFGLSVLEAALSSCALVLGDIPSLRELWDGCAVFVDAERSVDLQRELTALMGDPARTSLLGRRARERALRYSSERMATAYLTLYRELLARRAPSSTLSGAQCA